MNEEMLRRRMMEFERKRARLGFSTMLPDDKRKRIWREPLTKNELHVVTFMREHGTISAEDLAGAMDEELQEMRRVLLRLIDRQYVKVVSQRGYAKYRARTKDELQDDLE
jgi:transcription initiation factor IIE alpha subunit